MVQIIWGKHVNTSQQRGLETGDFVCLPWSEVCSARVTSLLLLLLLFKGDWKPGACLLHPPPNIESRAAVGPRGIHSRPAASLRTAHSAATPYCSLQSHPFLDPLAFRLAMQHPAHPTRGRALGRPGRWEGGGGGRLGRGGGRGGQGPQCKVH